MSDTDKQTFSYLSQSSAKKAKKKNASITTDTLGVAKEALYDKKSMINNSYKAGGGKSTFGRRSGDR